MSRTYTTIEFYPGPRVASIVLNRPPLNIITIEMIDELNAAFDEADELQVQIVVFSGKGDRAFSSGVDVRDHAPEKAESMLGKFHRVIRRIRQSDCIAVAGIHGYTLGGGAELALACDLVIAAGDASIGFPEIDVGCYPPAAAAILARSIGRHKASEMILLGRPIPAEEAERMALVNKVVARGQLSETVDQYVGLLLVKSAPVLALTKRALRASWDAPFEQALQATENLYLDGVATIEDMREGIQAFLEKRLPAWKNR